MRGGNKISSEVHEKMMAFEDKLNAVAEQMKAENAGYPNIEFKPGEYCQISKSDILQKHAEKSDGVIPYYAQKLHVSLELQDGDHEKVWDQVLLELFKNPCVFGVKILSPYATAFGRPAAPGKEVTIYFLRPEDMDPPVSLPSVKVEHLKVIKKLDDLMLPLKIKSSVPPTNKGESEFNAAEVCNDTDESKKGLELKSLAIYISPPDQNAKGEYVSSSKRETQMHTYTQDVLAHRRRADASFAKLDFLISMMPKLTEISATHPNIEFQNLLATISETIHNENTVACLDSIKVFADYCSQVKLEETAKKTGLFGRNKSETKDTRMQDVSRVILKGLADKNVGLRDFKEAVKTALKIDEQPEARVGKGKGKQ